MRGNSIYGTYTYVLQLAQFRLAFRLIFPMQRSPIAKHWNWYSHDEIIEDVQANDLGRFQESVVELQQ